MWGTRSRAMARGAVVVLAVVALVGGGEADAATSGAALTYRVRSGDTLTGIAARLKVKVDDLARTNDIRDRNQVVIGSVLKVPVDTSNPLVIRDGVGQHVVVRGETLSSIAARHHVPPSLLRKLNALTDGDRIRIGQTLRVPASAWRCPVMGMQAGSFDDSWGSPRPGGRRHLGTDLFARRGTPVRASVSGTVTHVIGSVAGRAFYLRGDDGTTYYGAHLDSFAGGPRRVRAGDVLGTVGRSGNAEHTPPHLHFEIKPRGGAPVNPYPTLRVWCR